MSDTNRRAEDKLTVRLPAALASRIEAAAREQGLGRSAFVRRALAAQTAAVLGSDEPTSLYDVLLRDGIIGRVAGPPGLSTTRRAAIQARVRARSSAAERSAAEDSA